MVAHKSRHMFGLVANNNVLGGDAGKHNPVPNGTRVMDDGEIVPYEIRFWRTGDWGWRPLNAACLTCSRRSERYVEGELMKKTAWLLPLVFVSLVLVTCAQQTNLWVYSEELGF